MVFLGGAVLANIVSSPLLTGMMTDMIPDGKSTTNVGVKGRMARTRSTIVRETWSSIVDILNAQLLLCSG